MSDLEVFTVRVLRGMLTLLGAAAIVTTACGGGETTPAGGNAPGVGKDTHIRIYSSGAGYAVVRA